MADLFDIVVARKLSGGGGGAWTVLTEETVTTVADHFGATASLSYSTQIDAATIRVTLNGTSYECPRMESPIMEGLYMYGASDPSFSDYPFVIQSGLENSITTQSAGTYTVKIDVPSGGK